MITSWPDWYDRVQDPWFLGFPGSEENKVIWTNFFCFISKNAHWNADICEFVF